MADSKRRQSGSNEEVDIKDCRRARDLASGSGKRTFWRESRASSASCRGRAPLFQKRTVSGECKQKAE